MPTPPQSTSPVSFMPALATYLTSGLSAPTNYVKIVDEATFRGKFTEVLAQDGIALCLGSAVPPNPVAGGGRYDYRITRTLYVGICTETLADPAGRSEVALGQHWTLEDQVTNLLLAAVVPPLVIPILPKDITAARFDLPVDSGRYRSVLGFSVTYPAAVTNTCG